MPSDRRLRRFVRQWRRRYPYPVDWVDNRANKQCRRSETGWLARFEGLDVLRRRDVMALIDWRLGSRPDGRAQALAGIDGPAAWGHARRRIKKALASANPATALDLLLGEQGGIPGWGPPMASVVLSACRPDDYPIADHRALVTVQALDLYRPRSDGEFVRLDWVPYLKVCRRLAKVSGFALRDVDRALWAAAGEAPRLPKQVERRAARRTKS